MLYKLDTTTKSYQKVKRVTFESIGWSEQDLENMIASRINDVLASSELMTIFTQRKFQEEPDIIAIDRHGELYLLELKRWSSQQENLLQVLRYGQLYGNSDYDELNQLWKKYSGQAAKELVDVHQQYFQLNEPLAYEQFNARQHFLLVTNGLDQKTIEAMMYWRKNGLSIDAIVYWVFEIGHDHFIEFNTYSPIEGYLEYESNSYILNTNYANDPRATQQMIYEKKAAAYHKGWREKIEKLQKGDYVFLYQSGVGIIAYGIADGKVQKKDYGGVVEGEYFMKLTHFYQLEPPISAAEMKRVTQKGFNFRQTMFAIDEECRDRLLAVIKP